jgi:hypothetical protein
VANFDCIEVFVFILHEISQKVYSDFGCIQKISVVIGLTADFCIVFYQRLICAGGANRVIELKITIFVKITAH